MTVFIELTTDAFDAVFKTSKQKDITTGTYSRRAGLDSVRRPLRGVEIKEDTYAILKLIKADGTAVPLLDSGSITGESEDYANFILQGMQEARMERHQIFDTFGEPYIFFFGEAPRFLDVKAIILNTNDFNWEAEWWENYDKYLRGTKSVEMGARTYLFFDDTILEGYMLNASCIKASTAPYTLALTFRLFLTNYSNISFAGDPNFPIRESVDLPPGVELTNGDAFEKLQKAYRGANTEAMVDEKYSESNIAYQSLEENTFGGGKALSRLLRETPASLAFPPQVQEYIDSHDIEGMTAKELTRKSAAEFWGNRMMPLRSQIATNIDEWTGAPGYAPTGPDVVLRPISYILEVSDLHRRMMEMMQCYAAIVDTAEAMKNMGMGPYFAPDGGRGIGFGSGAPSSASFGASAWASVGAGQAGTFGGGQYGTSTSGFTPNGAAYSSTYGNRASSAYIGASAYGQASPGGYGGGYGSYGTSYASPYSQIGPTQRPGASTGLIEALDGYGDPSYGYPSPYGGVGYGQSGYGDYGGQGYGSCFGAGGDPGHKHPNDFSFSGVPDAQGEFDALIHRSAYGSTYGGHSSAAGFAGEASVGASVSVGGSISAFSMSAVEGNLDPTATYAGGYNPYLTSQGIPGLSYRDCQRLGHDPRPGERNTWEQTSYAWNPETERFDSMTEGYTPETGYYSYGE